MLPNCVNVYSLLNLTFPRVERSKSRKTGNCYPLEQRIESIDWREIFSLTNYWLFSLESKTTTRTTSMVHPTTRDSREMSKDNNLNYSMSMPLAVHSRESVHRCLELPKESTRLNRWTVLRCSIDRTYPRLQRHRNVCYWNYHWSDTVKNNRPVHYGRSTRGAVVLLSSAVHERFAWTNRWCDIERLFAYDDIYLISDEWEFVIVDLPFDSTRCSMQEIDTRFCRRRKW